MQVTFHWLRVQIFCYATENPELISETMEALLGTSDFDREISVSEHGNEIMIFSCRMTKQKEFKALFSRLGDEVIDDIKGDIENRVDEDCTFYIRLDKQEAVQGRYRIAHHGDVIAITGKVQSHPARKDVAVRNMLEFLDSIPHSESVSSSD